MRMIDFRPKDKDYAGWWIANIVMDLRALIAIPCVLLIFAGRYADATWLILIERLLDWVDGAFARRYKATSGFGVGMDPVVDSIVGIAVQAALSFQGFFSMWWQASRLISIAPVPFCYLVPSKAKIYEIALEIEELDKAGKYDEAVIKRETLLQMEEKRISWRRPVQSFCEKLVFLSGGLIINSAIPVYMVWKFLSPTWWVILGAVTVAVLATPSRRKKVLTLNATE